MIKGRYLNYTDNLDEIYKVRDSILKDVKKIKDMDDIKEKQEMIDVKDDLDDMAVHALLIDEKKKSVAVGRIIYDGYEYRIGLIFVIKEERGKGYGEVVVRMLLDKAFLSGAKEVLVEAHHKEVRFYEKLGFREVNGIKENEKGRIMKITKENICSKCKGVDE
jgi:predicted GNAT family N-acyltransferase